jgi:hypothetical protein
MIWGGVGDEGAAGGGVIVAVVVVVTAGAEGFVASLPPFPAGAPPVSAAPESVEVDVCDLTANVTLVEPAPPPADVCEEEGCWLPDGFAPGLLPGAGLPVLLAGVVAFPGVAGELLELLFGDELALLEVEFEALEDGLAAGTTTVGNW